MKTSARNTFSGTVTQVTKGAVNAEIQLTTKGGDKLVAIITNGSVDSLGLTEGKAAFALVKASWVILGKELHKIKMSTRNILCGTVDSIHEGAVNSEVSIKLPGGQILTAVITNTSVRSLELRQGEHACGAFKASSVIIGID
jgi:molybdate transport system regulatory protein